MKEPEGTTRKIGPRDVGVSPFALRIWNGMALDAFLKLMKGNWSRVSPGRYPAVATILVTASFNQLRKWIGLAFLEPTIRKVKIEPDPIFVIGHWRSGTTWLHHTMLADPGLAAPTMQNCFTPECFLVGRRALEPLLRLIFPTRRPMDNVGVGLDAPEEDEHALLLSGAYSPYREILLPCDTMGGTIIQTKNMPEHEAENWRRVWLGFLRRVQWINPGKRLVLKSPAHTLRIEEILRLFPNARFIHIVRDPYRIFFSARKSGDAMRASQALQTQIPSQEVFDAKLLDGFAQFHAIYHAHMTEIPERQLVTLSYEDLKEDTLATMRRVYEALDLGDFDQVANLYQQKAAGSRNYKTNTFEIEPEIVAEIDRLWHDYFQRYGYQKLSERSSTGST
ncbi:sulfotransferase family protein [Nioella aestuarii]|uniref:sulfotransferase family protein n=1 Tax=Nioella aestuarii TaxID=1662864 RepID=UPI003D7FB4BD